MNVAIIGAGAWGTALALRILENGNAVRLWIRNPDLTRDINARGENIRYLPGVPLPKTLKITSRITEATDEADVILIVVPSHGFRKVVSDMVVAGCKARLGWASATKGIEIGTDRRMSEILSEFNPGARVGSLSGPNLAHEIARGMPAAMVAGSTHDDFAEVLQKLTTTNRLRVYTSRDLVGVEMGGALKNVVAIAAGVCDGLGFGENSKASLVTRGLLEMTRLAVSVGGRPETISGLSGVGDLMVTCFSKNSRNRTFGEKLGRGMKINDILGSQVSVVEGVKTARSASELACKKNLDTPIINAVNEICHLGKPVGEAMTELLSRELKSEHESTRR